jgi:hypothetical protein
MRYKHIIPIFFVFLFLATQARAQLSAVPDPVQYTVAPETPATVVCKKKIQRGETNDRCCVIDNSYCPRKKETKA